MKILKYILAVCVLSITHLSNAQSLDSLLQLAVENNPELNSLLLEYNAELQKVDRVNCLTQKLEWVCLF